nr:PREDICTED: protein scabrous-like [Bemisia tabaci]
MRTLQANQSEMKRRVAQLEKQVAEGGGAGATSATTTAETGMALLTRVGTLEMKAKTHSDSLLNVTEQVTALDKLHSSMLQLLESVESLENKVDKNIPDLQREISKLEFNFAKISSSLQLITEDQDNQRVSVKAMGVGLSNMQSKQEADQIRINSLEAEIHNITSSNIPSNTSFSDLITQLTRVHKQYDQIVRKFPTDCNGVNESTGLTVISPAVDSLLFASCKEGWTVIQRRINGSENFDRKWAEYAAGFGSPSGEFWIGNEVLHQLTKNNDSMLRVDFTDIDGKNYRAEYSEFSVSSKEDGYRLNVAGYSGNASDALEYQNRMQFSAIDSDRDISNTNCAANYEGGWWFSYCQHANLNGQYNLGLTWFDVSRNEWIAVVQSEMSIRPRPKSS